MTHPSTGQPAAGPIEAAAALLLVTGPDDQACADRLRLFCDRGWRVAVAQHGREVPLLEQNPPALVVMETVLGGAALETCRRLKRLRPDAQPPVVLIQHHVAADQNFRLLADRLPTAVVPATATPDELLRTIEAVWRAEQRQRAFRNAESHWAVLSRSLPQGLGLIDAGGNLLFRNAALELLLDREVDGPAEVSVYRLLPALQQLPVQRAVEAALVEGRSIVHAWQQGQRSLELTVAPAPGTDGRPAGCSLALVDVTAQRQDELQRLTEIEAINCRLRDELARWSAAAIETAPTPRLGPQEALAAAFPGSFAQLSADYSRVLDQLLEQRAYGLQTNVSAELRAVAERLGQLNAGPRDVVDLHRDVMKERLAQATNGRGQAYLTEGRVLVVELMGYLTAYYQLRCSRPASRSESPRTDVRDADSTARSVAPHVVSSRPEPR